MWFSLVCLNGIDEDVVSRGINTVVSSSFLSLLSFPSKDLPLFLGYFVCFSLRGFGLLSVFGFLFLGCGCCSCCGCCCCCCVGG